MFLAGSSEATSKVTSSTNERQRSKSVEKWAMICEVKSADRIGLIGDPCGVPILGRGKGGEVVLLIRKELERSLRNEHMVLTMDVGKPYSWRR